MVLLHVLHKLAAGHRWQLAVAHFNHQLRGAASDTDARLVERTASKLGVEFISGQWAKEEQRNARRHGLEMAARLARHEFLSRAAKQFNARVIATAHHADDQAELFLLRLLRGSGGDGLGGMKWQGPSPADKRLTLIRPLLDLSKDELSAYARRQRIRFREDASNRILRHDRNWVRRSLLPSLTRRFGAASVTAILRAMELVGVDSDFAQQSAEHWLANQRHPRFDRLHTAVQRQAVRLQLKRLGLPMGFELVERLRLHTNKPVSATSRDAVVRDAAGIVARHPAEPPRFQAGQLDVELSDSGQCGFAGIAVQWRREPMAALFRRPKPRAGQESFDATRVGTRITLRHWRPGDRFQPIGMKQPVKLQDLFTNAKIPQSRRRAIIVATTSRGEMFWVEELRMGERFKLSKKTRIRLEWRWSKHLTLR